MFLKIKNYQSRFTGVTYTWDFQGYAIINTEQITVITEMLSDNKKIYGINIPFPYGLYGAVYVDKEDAAKIFKVIGTSL